MGYGTGKKDMPTVRLGVAMAGKMSGGGVDLSAKKESDMQESKNLLDTNAIDNTATSMGEKKEGVISGGFSKKMGFAAPHSFKKMKPVPADKQKSLGQLPTEVRNNMGFEKYDYSMKKAADFDKDMAEERIQIKDDKEKIFEDDKEKKDSVKKSKHYKM
tara:strand:+ start:181 stop:657 length:477 start_codon:yes stop_codon:yes gene_type:complete